MAIVAVLSIRSGIGFAVGIFHSVQRLVSQALIRAVSEAALSSASVLDRAIVFCGTLPQCTR